MISRENAQQRLEQLGATLQQRLEAIHRDIASGRSADSEERAAEAENDEALQEIQQQTETELGLIKHALEKIANGRYSQCDVCGSDIGEARLTAMPYAATCFSCAEKTDHAY